ncbi:glycosyltransferase family 2 protein, partial [Paraburkholderia sp. SIMBA_055]
RGVRERLFQIASENNSYSDWVQRYSTVSPDMRVRITDLIGEMEQPPTISIVMSVFNPDLDWFAKVVASVREQLYPHWQLSIAD